MVAKTKADEGPISGTKLKFPFPLLPWDAVGTVTSTKARFLPSVQHSPIILRVSYTYPSRVKPHLFLLLRRFLVKRIDGGLRLDRLFYLIRRPLDGLAQDPRLIGSLLVPSGHWDTFQRGYAPAILGIL